MFQDRQAKLLFPTVKWQRVQDQDDLMKDTTAGGDVTLGGDVALTQQVIKYFFNDFVFFFLKVKVLQ